MENNEIKSIEFIFENCESIEIPYECFTQLDFKGLNKQDEQVTFESFKCVIEDKGNIEYSSGFYNKTPIQRINYYNDITNIYIKYADNSFVHVKCPWYYENEFDCSGDNEFQQSKMPTYNKIELSIVNNSKWYNLNEALSKLEDGTKIEDQDGKIYTIYYDENEDMTYLFDTIVNNKILNSKFQKVS
jgi:hypothetical protein